MDPTPGTSLTQTEREEAAFRVVAYYLSHATLLNFSLVSHAARRAALPRLFETLDVIYLSDRSLAPAEDEAKGIAHPHSSSSGLFPGREIHGLETLGSLVASSPHVASAVTRLYLTAIPPQFADQRADYQIIYYTDAITFITLLHNLPNLRRLELTDVVLTGDSQSIAVIVRDLGNGNLSLYHLSMNFITYSWVPIAPGDLRNILSLFDSLDELRFKHARRTFPMDTLPFPERLQVKHVFISEKCWMAVLFKCLKNLPAIHMLKGLDVGDNILGPVEVRRLGRRYFFDLLSIVGPGLEHFGAGPETYTVQEDAHFPDTIRQRVLPHLWTGSLVSVAVPVVLMPTESLRSVMKAGGENGWTANRDFLCCLRNDASAGRNIQTIYVSLTYECDEGEGRGAFMRQAKLCKPWFDALEQELLQWEGKKNFECVVVEVTDMSQMGEEDLQCIMEEDIPLMFPRLERRGMLSVE